MVYRILILQYLALVFSIQSSPLFLNLQDLDLQKKIDKCTVWENKKKFQFKQNHFLLKEIDLVNEEMRISSNQSGKSRISQIKCIVNLNMSAQEKKEVKESLIHYRDKFLGYLEYYNRWLYSFEKVNLMTPMDKQYTSEFLLLKYDLYNLIHQKTTEAILSDEVIEEEEFESLELQIRSIYLSLLKGNFEFYNAIHPEFRKELLSKISH